VNRVSAKREDTFGSCQTRNKEVQVCRATTLFLNKVACLTSRVAHFFTSRATKLLDRNRLYSSALSNIHLTPLIQRWSNYQSTAILSSSVSLEANLVWRLFTDEKLTVATAIGKVAR